MAGKKVLLIASEFPPNVGGIGNHAYHLAKSLATEGYAVNVMADIIDIPKAGLHHFSALQNFTINWIKRESLVFITYSKRVSLAITLARKADVIICSGKFPLWLGKVISTFSKKKMMVAIVHGSELDIKSSWAKRMTNAALKSFNKIVAVSNYTQQYLPANLAASKYIIHNGIEISEFENVASKQLPGTPALITVGSVTERKGQQNVVTALDTIINKYPQAQYHIVGKPVIKTSLQQLAKTKGVDAQVHFYGAVSRADLLGYLAASKIKLMLSNHTADGDFEGFGIAVLEANALGKPVIGSRNSGIADAIVHEQTGILVDPKNVNEVAAAVEAIMNNYDFYSANAIEWAKQHDWAIIIKQYIRVIEN